MIDFTESIDLASERVGGRVIYANDDFFAPKENLIKASEPVFIAEKYTDRGKWMDGWETRRRRSPGFDWCIVQLGCPGIVRGMVVDTSYFKGNYPEHSSIEACSVEAGAELNTITSDAIAWIEVLAKSALQGDSKNRFEVNDPYRYTHLRVKIYPDGGVARLRVYGEVVPDWTGRPLNESIDLAAIENGGRVVDCSDKFFSAPQNLLMPGKSTHMGDGWETRRRRGPGHDWVVVRLGTECVVEDVEVDTSHFKGNFPASCSLEICQAPEGQNSLTSSCNWQEIIAKTALEADSVRRFPASRSGPATHIRLNIFPDGGVARLRVFAAPTQEGRTAVNLRLLNSLPPQAASAALMNCCGSGKWVEQVVSQRPFASPAQLFDAAERAAGGLSKPDWLEAFSHHPQIGQQKALVQQSAQAQQWSAEEQKVAAGTEAQLGLAEANREYQAKFGHIFIVCATGKSAEEILSILKKRIGNTAEQELQIAAGEQRKITRLRLEKILGA